MMNNLHFKHYNRCELTRPYSFSSLHNLFLFPPEYILLKESILILFLKLVLIPSEVYFNKPLYLN